jgi:hypothetical protein
MSHGMLTLRGIRRKPQVALYELHIEGAAFNANLAASPHVGHEIWLHSGEHAGNYLVKRVVHTELDERDERPSTWLFLEAIESAARP